MALLMDSIECSDIAVLATEWLSKMIMSDSVERALLARIEFVGRALLPFDGANSILSPVHRIDGNLNFNFIMIPPNRVPQ